MISIFLIGDTDVGKSTIIDSLKSRSFNPTKQTTVGVEFCTYITEIEINGEKKKI